METDFSRVYQLCWIVVALFCAMGNINTARLLIGNNLPAAANHLSSHQNNVLFMHMESSIDGSDLTNFRILIAMADERNMVGEELLVDYRRGYMFPTITKCMDRYSLRS